MGFKCVVPGCRSNYTSEYKDEHVRMFAFPKDEERKSQWLKSINRTNYTPTKYSHVCIYHFCDSFLIREDQVILEDGSIIMTPRKSFTLTKDAIPTIFPTQRVTGPEKPPTKKKRRKCFAEPQEEMPVEEQSLDPDKISSFDNFKVSVETRMDSHDWTLIKQETYVIFCLISHSDAPDMILSFKFFSDLSIKIWSRGVEIPTKTFQWILGKKLACDSWTKLETLLRHLASQQKEDFLLDANESLKCATTLVKKAIQLEGLLFDSLKDHESKKWTLFMKRKERLNFAIEQIELAGLEMKKAPYSPELLLWATNLYYHNKRSYTQLLNTGKLTIPDLSYFKKNNIPSSSDKKSQLHMKEEIDDSYSDEQFTIESGSGISFDEQQSTNSWKFKDQSTQTFVNSFRDQACQTMEPTASTTSYQQTDFAQIEFSTDDEHIIIKEEVADEVLSFPNDDEMDYNSQPN